MGSADRHTFLDGDGNPLDARLQCVLRDLRPRFCRRLPLLDDDVCVTEVLEDAGRRIAAYEAEHGRVGNLEAFAWTTAMNVARSRFARSSMRVVGATLGGEASEAVLRALHARDGTREQIEADILVQQLLARLTPVERDICFLKAWGHSSREIARACGMTEGQVNTIVYRMRLKIRDLLRSPKTQESEPLSQKSAEPRAV